MSKSFFHWALLLLSCGCLVFLGCDDDDHGDGDGELEIDGSSLTHAADIQPVWNARCGGCHLSSSQAGLNLNDGYDSIVGVQATQADLNLVEAGDLETSYLWHKIEGTQASVGGSGRQMPIDASLSGLEAGTIEAWIEAGAVP